jgi:hypothetical protein
MATVAVRGECDVTWEFGGVVSKAQTRWP